MLGEADDRRPRRRLQVGERRQLLVLGLLDVGVYRPSVRTALGISELFLDSLDHLVRERVAELVGVHVRFGCGVVHEIGQEALDDPVLADDLLGACAPRLGEDRLLLLAAFDQALALESLQHLTGRRTGDSEHLGHTRGERCGAGRLRAVLADREGEEVDRLQVLVDGVALCHTLLNCTGRVL